jgi:hypothetical protein
MRYYWHGGVIFRDTLLPNEQFVIGSPQCDFQMGVREWLSNEFNGLGLKDALARLPAGATGSLGPLGSRGTATTADTRR